MILWPATLAAIFIALTAGPLALGSWVVVQRATPTLQWAWFGLLGLLLVASLAAAALALALLGP